MQIKVDAAQRAVLLVHQLQLLQAPRPGLSWLQLLHTGLDFESGLGCGTATCVWICTAIVCLALLHKLSCSAAHCAQQMS